MPSWNMSKLVFKADLATNLAAPLQSNQVPNVTDRFVGITFQRIRQDEERTVCIVYITRHRLVGKAFKIITEAAF